MHGSNSGSTLIVNAEVGSMGGIVDGGVDIDTKPSPRQTAIEKAQAELRVEYDVREERRRELEFLEKGGDPLDFKFGRAASVSVQSTSNTDQHQDINFTSEAKGSFALTASPHGDSVESNGGLGVTTAGEQNSADNFDGENEILQNDRKFRHSGRNSITLLEHSQRDGCRDVKDSDDSPIFHPKKGQAYRRRNRSRASRDGPRSSSADMTSHEGHVSSMPAPHMALSKSVASENQFEIESDGTHAIHSSMSRDADLALGEQNLSKSEEKLDEVLPLSLKTDDVPVALKMVEANNAVEKNNVDTVDAGCPPSSSEKAENNASCPELHETSVINGDKCTPTDALVKNAPVMMKGLDSESSCTQTNVSVDGIENIDNDLCTNLKNVDCNGAPKGATLSVGENSVRKDDRLPNEELVAGAVKNSCNEDKTSVSLQGNGFNEDCAEVVRGKSSLQDVVNGIPNVKAQEEDNATMLKSEPELERRDSCISKIESSCPMTSLMDPVSSEVNKSCVSGSSPVLDSQPSTENQPKTLDKAQEDRILEEARMIEAKRKRIAELSVSVLAREHRHRCHWDLVLEEMAWLSNDFAQERVWKMTAAAQICRRVAFAVRKRLEEQSKISKQKGVAHTLAKAVMEFWHSASLIVENGDSPLIIENCKHEVSSGVHETDKASQDDLQCTRRKQDHAVYGYAVRFLQFNRSPKPVLDGEVPGFANVLFDVDLPDVSWEDQFTEENLFYAVPPGAMEMYRKSIMSHLADCERIGKNNYEEADISGHDAADCGYEDHGFEEDEGENLYYLPGAIDTGKPSKKKRKNRKSYEARSYEYGGDVGYGHCAETRNGTPQLNVTLKRPTNNLHVDPIPTKRIRTASRQRVVGPFGAGPAGFAPVLSRADASSGDTNSFQDDLSTLHGASIVPRGSEVDSAMNFEKQSTFDSAEMPAKPKKKKKIKHSSVSHDQRWQLDSSMQNEQKDLVRKRVDHQLESNGNGGLYGQHAKKPKLAKHLLENSFDNSAPMSGSVASPVASQMSNMSSQTKIIKFIGSRDRGKKGKGLKLSTGQHGSGGPWTIVEDQALVVLVHDMGPNWELVSDAINNILQFKCIFRKPQECKERHKFLMDRPSGDGADSAEDSGSSQPYPSTLPGIPKGSARQLFRSLHAHVEEDNIKSRFEKIIHIEQQFHFRKKKNDNQDLKQRAPIHSSHVLSLSQVIPNNLNGDVLTPLDLCDIATSSQDPLSTVYQQPNGLQLPSQSSIPSIHSPGGPSPSPQGLQGSPSMGRGNNMTPPPSQYTSSRDARYSVPRSGSLPIEEQQRLTQNSMLPGRNAQASTLSSSGSLSGSDRGMRMHPGGNGVGIMPGMNRSIPMARPGVQGIPSSSMLNSGSVLASNVGGMRGSMTPHAGIASGHGNTMFRPRDSLHGVRSGQSSEHQRQVVLPEMQIQTTQTNSTGVHPFGGLSSGFSTQIDSPPLPSYPGHPHVLGTPHPHLSTSNHSATPEQQAYLRIARERQIQQRLLQRQHQLQHPASSMTHQQPSVPLPSLSPASPATHMGAVPHQQQKNLQGHGRSSQSGPGGVVNQGAKQRQRPAQQQYQQAGRQHPQQRQQSQSQQAKLAKGIGNIPIDPSQLNGFSVNTVSQVAENLHSPSSNHTQPQKPYVNVASVTSKPAQQISSHLEGGNQGQGLCSNQGSSSTHSRNHQQFQGQSAAKVVNQPQPALQRSTQQSCLAHSDFSSKSQVDHSQSYQKSCDVGPPSAVAAASPSSNVVRKVQDPICESAMTGASSSSGPSSSKDVTNSLGNCLENESRKQQQESQLQAPPLEPVLQQKQSQDSQQQLQQLEQPLQRVPQSQSQPQIQDGRNVVFTRTSNSRLD